MRVAITMGDAAGIGPELVLRAHEEGAFKPGTVVIGDYSVLRACCEVIGARVELRKVVPTELAGVLAAEPTDDAVNASFSLARPLLVCDLGMLTREQVEVGKVCVATGKAAAEYVRLATHLALEGIVDGFVTCPINKESTRLSIPNFTGHTELIAELCGSSEISMMLASDKLVVSHVSTHVSLREAIGRVTQGRVLSVIRLTDGVLRRFMRAPRIAVCGLNPHAGENKAFGTEDAEEIAPAIMIAKQQGIDATGPEPADTVFYRALNGEFDAVVCMYHDQGHIPMKSLDFHGGVNITLGLPIVRTSVDHGTAFTIAWQGKASSQSLRAAYSFAERLIGSAD